MTNEPGWPGQGSGPYEAYPGSGAGQPHPAGHPVYPNQSDYQPFGGGQAYPGGPTPGKRTPPQTVTYAFYLMLAGAALTVIGMLVGFTQIDEVRKKTAEAGHQNLSDHDLDTLVNIGLGVGVVIALISTGLWLWMAFANRAGKNWARITGTVFFGLETLSIFVALAMGNSTALTVAIDILDWLIGLAIVILLWNKRSSDYFRPAPVYPPYPPTYPGGSTYPGAF